MSLPDVLIIGPMRTGTTWVYDYLRARGDVCLPRGVKETFFFDRNYEKGIEWYKAHFSNCDEMRQHRIIEVAPSYFHNPEAPGRILETLGNVRLVVVLRDPVQRAWSHYLHLLQYGYTRAPLREAVVEFPEILEASRYATQLQRWRGMFGNGVHVLFYEELDTNAAAYCTRLCNVLQLDFLLPAIVSGKRSNPAVMPISSRLARTGRTIANALRSRRMYFIINVAKSLGMKRIFFGHSGSNLPQLREVDSAWLVKQLEPEVRGLQSEFAEYISAWRSFSI